jgi:Transposase
LDALVAGVRLWLAELLACSDEPTTNGYAEGVINKVKLIKRRAYGLSPRRACSTRPRPSHSVVVGYGRTWMLPPSSLSCAVAPPSW